MERRHSSSGLPARVRPMPAPSPPTAPTDGTSKDDAPRARRLLPEPVETTTRSSKTARKHSPEKEQAPKVRRFAPEPVETTTKSSKDAKSGAQKPDVRRFAPEPIETTQKSSKDKADSTKGSGHIKFKPQLVETTYGGNRKSSRRDSTKSDGASTVASEEGAPRKFTPVVLSTAKRSRRAGDSNNANYQNHRTEEGFLIHAREAQRHAGWESQNDGQVEARAGESGHAVSPRSHEFPSELRRPISPLDGSAPARPAALTQTRKHSFRCPELDTIESSESEQESGPSSMSCSPGQGSPITTSDSSFNEYYKHATRIRESVDENFSHYLLQLEAKRAERRLQEQALAAFPNSDFHEPVQHYVNDDQDSIEDEVEDRPVTWEGFEEEETMTRKRGRDSTSKVPWEQLEMQRHAAELEQERKANKATSAAPKDEKPSPWWNPAAGRTVHQPESEMRSMRDRARPPMLGRSLVFPRCPSPEPARFDVTQGSDKLREQMCYLSAHTDSRQDGHEGGLWNAAPRVTNASTTSRSTAKSGTAKGLWGGFCAKVSYDEDTPGLMPPSGPTGLMTPAPQTDTVNPFEQSFAQPPTGSLATLTTPPTPPADSLNTQHLDAVLSSEAAFEATFAKEYPDTFVTQVYNYLSLGYPSLARPFDEELSKISRIPVATLRQDDSKAKSNPRGYIRLGEDFERRDGVRADECMRWQALKLYVREWARQEKDMVRVDAPGGNWATTNRRGSWAW